MTPSGLSELVQVRKRALTVETIYHEFGPIPDRPLRVASAAAVIKNPYAGRYEPDLIPFMKALRPLGSILADDLIGILGGISSVEGYSKASIVGVNGELEHGAVWHEAGGWAMREALGNPKAMVPSAKAVGATGFRIMVPLHNIHASYVRSHYVVTEIGIQDAPRPDEILFALAMSDGGRVHSRLGGLGLDDVSDHDGQR